MEIRRRSITRVPGDVIRLAAEEALKSNISKSKGTCRMSAVIWDRHGIVSSGYNMWTSAEMTSTYFGVPYRSRHPEVAAIYRTREDWRWRLERASMFVYRVGWRTAMPCCKCMSIIDQVGISKLYWTVKDGGIEGIEGYG